MPKNVEVVRKMYEAFHAGDASGSLAHFAPDVILDASRRGDGALGRGRDHLNATIAEWIGAFEDWREEIEEIRDVNGKVFVVAVQHGRGKSSGAEVEQRYGVVFDLEGASIVRMTMYADLGEAVEAAHASD